VSDTWGLSSRWQENSLCLIEKGEVLSDAAPLITHGRADLYVLLVGSGTVLIIVVINRLEHSGVYTYRVL
jgi:hypothetical protein